MKTLTRQDAYDATNWRNVPNALEVECIFDEDGKTYRAALGGDILANIKSPKELEQHMIAAIKAARPIEILYPLPGSFMHQCFAKPPVYEEVLRNFQINIASTLFTFGDVIYNPQQIETPDDYVHHEELHAEQQGHNPEGAGRWWARYFSDPYFRIDQEARAYAHQYDYWCKKHKDRNQRNRKLLQLASTLASPMYGSVVGQSGAVDLIRRFSKTKR